MAITFPATTDEFTEFKDNICAILPTAGAPTTGTKATGTLTINGVVVDGERITLGARIYEFTTKADLSIDAGAHVAVNIGASATKAQGTLTMDTIPVANDTMTIGGKTYKFVATGAANRDGEIALGNDLAATKPKVVLAINGGDSVNTAHTQVTAAAFGAVDACVLTAIEGGTSGNFISLQETFTPGTNVFDAAKMGTTTAGADCSKGNAQTAIGTAVNGDASAVLGLGVFANDASVVTADAEGTAGNALASTTTGANCSFAAATLGSGANDTVGYRGQIRYDFTGNLGYLCEEDNVGDLTKWRKFTIAGI